MRIFTFFISVLFLTVSLVSCRNQSSPVPVQPVITPSATAPAASLPVSPVTASPSSVRPPAATTPPVISPVLTPSALPVPQVYRPLYDELSKELAQFELTLDQKGNSTPGKTIFATELAFANGNVGEGLLLPETMEKNRILLDQLQKMGLKGIVLSIKFPLLDPSFPRSAEYLKFYQDITAEARSRGLKVLVETGAIFSGTAFSPVKVDWSKYTSASFLKGMQDQLVLIAREIKPDYLTITEEPKTQEALTKLTFTNADWTAYVDSLLKRLDRSGGMLVGAGLGAWEDPSLAAAFIRMPALDYVDLHIYPPGRNGVFLERALTIAQDARRAGKRITIGESWLYKTLPEDLGGGPGISGDVFNNDVFSFWAPLDARFLNDIMRLADAADLDFVSFFWMRNFFAYLDYNPVRGVLPTENINRQINQAALANVTDGTFSPLGKYFQQQLLSRRNAPNTPSPISAGSK